MPELIDILDQNGNLLNQRVEKAVVHQNGHYHNTAHVWFYTKDDQLLLQQRSLKKNICPGLWDVSVAGHVDAGETVEEAGIRETQEEIGLKITVSDLYKIGVFECFQTYDNGVIDNEFHHTFLAELKVDLNTLKPQPEEVEDLKLVTINEFVELLNQSPENNHFVPTNRKYYKTVLEAVNELIG